MANYCSNHLLLEGTEENLKKVQNLFLEMKKKQKSTERGQLPDFISEENGGWFFYIYLEKNNLGFVQYETKWAQNTEIVQKIAERYNLTFTLDYVELGNLVYGKAIYNGNNLIDISLDGQDFSQYEEQEDFKYVFEGEIFECEEEILEILLERKIIKAGENLERKIA